MRGIDVSETQGSPPLSLDATDWKKSFKGLAIGSAGAIAGYLSVTLIPLLESQPGWGLLIAPIVSFGLQVFVKWATDTQKVILSWMVLLSLCGTAEAQIQIMPAEQVEALRRALPTTVGDKWQEYFNDPDTGFYTMKEMPAAYQHADAGLIVGNVQVGFEPTRRVSSFHSALNNISGDARETQKPDGLGGNANIEFPWRMGLAGGTDISEGIAGTFKMWRLPKRDGGGVWPVAWFNDVADGSRMGPHSVLNWVFPNGTWFAEVLFMRDSKGILHVWEVRVRVREKDYWDVDLLKPFVTSKQLATRLEKEGHLQLASAVNADRPLKEERLVDRLHRKKAFEGVGGVDVLPHLGEDLAAHLLDNTPFDSAIGAVWHEGTNGVKSLAPTASEPFSIVPPGYHGTFLGNDTNTCKNCHKHTLHHVDEFDVVRQWYGRVRGADQIFSWHPVEPSSVSPNGFRHETHLRRAFVEAGMLEHYDKAKHPPEMYSALPKE